MFKKDPLQIITFQTYGTSNHLYLRGRAIEDESISLEQKGLFALLINSWKRFETDEIKNTDIEVLLPNGSSLCTKTDNHGYFKIDEQVDGLDTMADENGWLNFEVAYTDPSLKRNIQNSNKFHGKLLIPAETAEFGIISDIDDTILHTGVDSALKWKVLVNSIFKSASSRIPLEGAAKFYHKLHLGSSGKNANPVFYVSHSPWNLYRYLYFFLKQHRFPEGPILLRSFKDIFKKKSQGDKPQKQKEILNILKSYPKLRFILIGDCGEHDPYIYMNIANEFPKRIKAIYLIRVKNKRKMQRVKLLYNNYRAVPVLLAKNNSDAILHAQEHGFIA